MLPGNHLVIKNLPKTLEKKTCLNEFSSHVSRMVLREVEKDDSWPKDMRRLKYLTVLMERILAHASLMGEFSHLKLARPLHLLKKSGVEQLVTISRRILQVFLKNIPAEKSATTSE